MLLREVYILSDNLQYKKFAKFLFANKVIKLSRGRLTDFDEQINLITFFPTVKRSLLTVNGVEFDEGINVVEKITITPATFNVFIKHSPYSQEQWKEIIEKEFPFVSDWKEFFIETLGYIVGELFVKEGVCLIFFKKRLTTPVTLQYLKKYHQDRFFDPYGTDLLLINKNCLNTKDLRKLYPSPKTIARQIYNNCQYYLEQIDYQPDEYKLYRGFPQRFANTYFKYNYTRRKNREPLDTPVNIHNLVNNAFEQVFGWKARDGVFASGSPIQAEEYAPQAHIIFPIGKFSFVWSDRFKDFYKEYVENYLLFVEPKDIPEIVVNHVKRWFTDKNLKKAILSGHEIMLTPHKGYAILNNDFGKEVIEYLKKLGNK